ncbi:hypothetical protein [Bernardetia sp.]|uniref:hypothetical protein n=1 Tax=Bernardetia sp. TaxID=1937974 RepID=UPI0025C58E5F|nr:hypothetical protein [Bernardetia sp.]
MHTSIIPQKMNIRIRVLHAIDYPEIAKEFQRKHTAVLEEFGVKGVGSVSNKWWEYAGSYMFIAEDIETGEMGAGMRLDVIDPTHDIPMEEAIERFSPNFRTIIHKYDNVLAESCGLWVDKKFSERKLPKNLMRAAIAISSKLRIYHLVSLPHECTLPMTQALGYTIVDQDGLGDHGTYNYPPKPNTDNECYKSTLVELLDTVNLPSMSEKERDLTFWLRNHPTQSINEEIKGRVTKLSYDLRLM